MKYKEVVHYECNYCHKVYDSKEQIKLHLTECIFNVEEVRTCVGCKHCVMNLVSPIKGKYNGYEDTRLLEVVGNRNFITCNMDIYSGKLSEEKVLRDKGCYQPVEGDTAFIINKMPSYIEWKEKTDNAIEQQNIIDAEIEDFHNKWQPRLDELREEGFSDEEIRIIIQQEMDELDNKEH